MRVVMTFGVFDLFHVGHLAVLERAAKLGDLLFVGVPADSVVFQDKGRHPVVSWGDRIRILESLRCVHAAYPYHQLEFLTLLKKVSPDILAVGETWGGAKRHADAEAWMERHGGRVIRLPYTSGVSSTAIKQRIAKGE